MRRVQDCAFWQFTSTVSYLQDINQQQRAVWFAAVDYVLNSTRELLPPVFGVVEDTAIALAIALLEEGYLVAQAKFYVLADVEVSLGRGLQVKIVPHTVLHTETDVVEGLIGTSIFIIIEQGTLTITIDGMISIIIVT